MIVFRQSDHYNTGSLNVDPSMSKYTIPMDRVKAFPNFA
jgi:hypothetical protein